MLLFRHSGDKWENVSAQSGPIFSKDLAAHGMAIGDFDNDGAVDVLVAVNDDAPVLLRNHIGRRNHWLGVRLIGKRANIDAIGAKIAWQAGDLRPTAYKAGGGSYASAHDPRIVLGLGQRTKVDWLEVTWPQPSGKVERVTDLPWIATSPSSKARGSGARSPWQKSSSAESAGEIACATLLDQQFAALVGQAIRLPRLLPRAASAIGIRSPKISSEVRAHVQWSRAIGVFRSVSPLAVFDAIRKRDGDMPTRDLKVRAKWL